MSDVPLLGSARDAPPFFAGRRGELDILHKRLAYIRATGDARGGMVLIDGVQGVGKTRLLEQFASTIAEDRTTAVLKVPPSAFANDLALFARIVDVLGGGDDDAKQLADAGGGVTGAKVAGVGVSAQRSARLKPSIDDMLVRSKRGGLWRHKALVIAVDEIQAIAVVERRTLRAIHDGLHECPIMLVAAGLQGAVLERSGGGHCRKRRRRCGGGCRRQGRAYHGRIPSRLVRHPVVPRPHGGRSVTPLASAP